MTGEWVIFDDNRCRNHYLTDDDIYLCGAALRTVVPIATGDQSRFWLDNDCKKCQKKLKEKRD